MTLSYIPKAEIERLQSAITDSVSRAEILGDIFRINTLSMIMEAGSGHIGSSFSAMDIVTWLWTEVMQNPNEPEKDPSDTFFSSKGHDVPGLYSVLIGLGKLDFDNLHKLRRFPGLPGHPDVGTPFIATNTGALGMGISKARGMAKARRLEGKKGHFYVVTGDGELEEGALWESLQPTANQRYGEITVIVDHNKIQSDTWVRDVSDLGDLEQKFAAFGWEVRRCNGNDIASFKTALESLASITDKPKVIIADTVKGKGVSFMELMAEDGMYKFHSGAPSPEHYAAALKELLERVNRALATHRAAPLAVEEQEIPPRALPENPERLVPAYGDELLKIAKENQNIVALDADLVLDTGLVPFKKELPERFIECGIAEQDMVSMAGGLALRGKIPVVHSFACFLSTRPNEQIYNNATEKRKVIYAASLAGLLPGGPGHSHQSVRDISAVGSVPGLTLIEPANELETRLAIRWAVEKNPESTYIRLVSIPVEIPYQLPSGYKLQLGRGVKLREGNDATVIAYGPVMLSEAWHAAEILAARDMQIRILNFPWLNRVDQAWLSEAVGGTRCVITIDDHYRAFGQGGVIAAALAGHIPVICLGFDEIPVSGQNSEVLAYHKLDRTALAERIAVEAKQ